MRALHFLEDLLLARGFPAKCCQWIVSCITSGTSSVLVNDSLVSHIRHRRGLRQGDPLSPYLFILGVDVFAKILSKGINNGFINRVGNFPPEFSIPCQQYADDTFLHQQIAVLFLVSRLSSISFRCFQALRLTLPNRPSTDLDLPLSMILLICPISCIAALVTSPLPTLVCLSNLPFSIKLIGFHY